MDVNILSGWDSKFTSTFLESFRRNLGQRSTGIQLIISIQMISQRELFRLRGHARFASYSGMEDWKALHLAVFAYIDSYHSRIEMAPYEALYGRHCRTPLCWTKWGRYETQNHQWFKRQQSKLTCLRFGLKKSMTVKGLCR